MADNIAISIKKMNKFFKIYNHPRDMLLEFITRRKRHQTFHALKDIDFEIKRGETVGFIGLNGAGKSTLLKIIANTLDKSDGDIKVNGSIAAILELGSGFKPEYTGRQNIYMGGMCLGMSRQDINAKLDSIIEFSELEEFIDQPFKTYSTGMQARLTFATAISVSPDILIIDEALSVGDAKFQVKCFERIKKMQESGVTILFVSHDINAICSLCSRAFLLDHGKIIHDNTPSHISSHYLEMLYSVSPKEPSDISDEASIVIKELQILDNNGREVGSFNCGESINVSIQCFFNTDICDIAIGIVILNKFGVQLFGTNNTLCGTEINDKLAGEKHDLSINLAGNLYQGDYSLLLRILGKDHVNNEVSQIRQTFFKIDGDSRQNDSSTIFLNPVFEG